MMNFSDRFIVRFSQFLPLTLPTLSTIQQTGEQVLVFAGMAAGYVGSAARGFFLATAVLLLAFHWTLEGPRTIQLLVLLLPKDHRENIGQLISAMSTKVGFYIIGQVVLCLVIGVLALAAYLIIGLPNALVLAFLAGVMEAVPLIGPLLGAIPAGVIALSIGPINLVWVIIATVVINNWKTLCLCRASCAKQLASIRSFHSCRSLPSAPFSVLLGPLAIPIAAILQLLLDRFVFHPAALEPDISPERDYTSRLL